MKRVFVVVGPTAVGKTRTGIELAHILDGEIISGDSMQIYKGMDIGTAKVTNDEMESVPHHMIDELNFTDSFSVFDFQTRVRTLISEISNRGKMPIIVGGTGHYIKAALYDYEFSSGDNIEHDFSSYTNEELYNKLLEVDHDSCHKIHMNNRQRVERAYNFYLNYGYPRSKQINEQKHEPIYDIIMIGLTMERELLYNRINNRVDLMTDNGLLEEVKSFYDTGMLDNQAMKGIGYKELFPYYYGDIPLDIALENIKQNSRKYAKRQLTYFKNQFDVKWFEIIPDNFQYSIDQIKAYVKKII